MHKKYGKDGVAAVSVDLDDAAQKETKEKVLRFLTKQKATFTNVILDEPAEVWQKKFNADGPPVIFVFDRDGKIAKKWDAGAEADELEKVVVDLIKKK